MSPADGPQTPADSREEALLALLAHLAEAGYRFVTPTPATQALVAARRDARAGDLRDVFGWTRPFEVGDVDDGLLALMRAAGAVEEGAGRLRSTVRVSTVDERLHLHSAPTSDHHAVFLGPDSYRFVRFLHQVLGSGPHAATALDVGVGAGVGAMTVAAIMPQCRVWGSDPNPEALRFCRINAHHAGLNIVTLLAEGLDDGPAELDLIVTNPPYIGGDGEQLYSGGGGHHGAELALGWVEQAIPRLSAHGRFVLYTGSAIVEGRDHIQAELQRLTRQHSLHLTYEELDPDVFGGTLRRQSYADVERIAAVGAVLSRRS